MDIENYYFGTSTPHFLYIGVICTHNKNLKAKKRFKESISVTLDIDFSQKLMFAYVLYKIEF